MPQTLNIEVWFFLIYFSAVNDFILTFLRCCDFLLLLSLQQCTYDLYALVNHFGNLTGGHYTADIKSFENGEWYRFNDDIVERVRRLILPVSNSSLVSQILTQLNTQEHKV